MTNARSNENHPRVGKRVGWKPLAALALVLAAAPAMAANGSDRGVPKAYGHDAVWGVGSINHRHGVPSRRIRHSGWKHSGWKHSGWKHSGYKRGYAAGKQDGWSDGYYDALYRRGYQPKPHVHRTGRSRGFVQGYVRGYDAAYQRGFREGSPSCGGLRFSFGIH